MSHPDDMHDALDQMIEREHFDDEANRRIEVLQDRLTMLSQLLTCAIAKLGGEIAVTTTEIERAVNGQQISVASLPNSRGFYVALVTYNAGDTDVVTPSSSVDVRNPGRPRT